MVSLEQGSDFKYTFCRMGSQAVTPGGAYDFAISTPSMLVPFIGGVGGGKCNFCWDKYALLGVPLEPVTVNTHVGNLY